MGKNNGTIDPDGVDPVKAEEADTGDIPVDGIGDVDEADNAGEIHPDGVGLRPAADAVDPGTISADGEMPDEDEGDDAATPTEDEALLKSLLGNADKAEPAAQAKPEAPKPEAPKPQPTQDEDLSGALQALTIDKAALAELRDLVGDDAATKVIEPLIATVGKMQKYLARMTGAINNTIVADKIETLLDSIGAPELGSRWEADEKQSALRREVVTVAETLMQNASAKGQPIKERKAIALAVQHLTRMQMRGNAPSAQAFEKRSKMVGVVPASARSTPAKTKKGTKAAIIAVDAKMREMGLTS